MCFCPPVVFPCSPALCFKAFGAFFSKMRFSIGVNGSTRIKYFSFSGNRPSFFAMLTCLHFHALFLDISGPAQKLRKSHLVILVLWCFVFRHLALSRCCSWTAFGSRLRAPLGLAGPPWTRDRFYSSWGRRFGLQNGHKETAETLKNKCFLLYFLVADVRVEWSDSNAEARFLRGNE